MRGCGHTDIREKFEQALNVCPECDYHRRIGAEDYIALLTDRAPGGSCSPDLRSIDPLRFEHYRRAAEGARKKAGDADALLHRHRPGSTGCRSTSA